MSRTKRPTLLNHEQLEKPLRESKQLADGYLQHAVWNRQRMSKAFRAGLTNAAFFKWAKDPLNVGVYNATIEAQRAILEKFEKELAVTEPDDRPIILELLKRLAFEESEE
jgi:hypothetical protein